MKNNLRKVNVKGIDWKYVVDKGREQVRIYKPDTKTILKRVPIYDVANEDDSVTPGSVKNYIENNIVTW